MGMFLDVTPPSVDFSTILDGSIQAIIDTFAVSNLMSLLTKIINAGAPYALLWWGVRKALRAIFSAVKRGKVRF